MSFLRRYMRTLILVDLQNDFLPGGALAVPEGDTVVPMANQLMPLFDLVVATQDWHPAEHGSFAINHPGKKPGEVIMLDGLSQILWPVHCVQRTGGAELAKALDRRCLERIFQKGTDPLIDSYSGFFDNGHRRATGLGEYLKAHGATEIFILGLATDYCVKYTALDARTLGFKTVLIEDGCRGVGLQSGDIPSAIQEMRAAGVAVIESKRLSVGKGP
jgi:nicotinamidase/pyrazinamidase